MTCQQHARALASQVLPSLTMIPDCAIQSSLLAEDELARFDWISLIGSKSRSVSISEDQELASSDAFLLDDLVAVSRIVLLAFGE